MKTNRITRGLKTITAFSCAGLFVLLTAGCGDQQNNMQVTAATMKSVSATQLSAVLNGAQEVPPTTSAGTGTATVTIDAARTTITVTLTTAGLVDVTASHIHFGAVGMNGGILFSLFAAPGVFPATLTKTLTSADFTPDAADGIITFADAVNAILGGNTYINVHTLANLGGEIRGQVTL